MDVNTAKEGALSGSISAIFHRTRHIVNDCLGPGKALVAILHFIIVLDAVSYIVMTQAVSSLFISTLTSSKLAGESWGRKERSDEAQQMFIWRAKLQGMKDGGSLLVPHCETTS